MTMRHFACLLACFSMCLASCDRLAQVQAPPAAATKPAVGGVGVVDLDILAKRLGRDIEMNNLVQERMTSLNSKLTSLQESLTRLYGEKRSSFGEKPTDEEQQQLAAMQTRMDQQLIESKRKAETDLVTYKQQLIDQFREQAKPVLKEVAAARGLSLVVPKNNALLLTIDPAVELTDEVAEKMLALQPAAAARETEETAGNPRKRPRAEAEIDG